MPTTWWGKAIQWIYVAGYCVYVTAAGIGAWSQMPWGQWWYYMVWQVVIYGTFWPLVVAWQIARAWAH